MTGLTSIPPLRDLPRGRLQARKCHLLSEITGPLSSHRSLRLNQRSLRLPRRPVKRSLALAAAAGCVLLASAWSVAHFEFHVFDAANTPPTPQTLLSWFDRQTDPAQRIDPSSIVAVGSFDADGRKITVYAARGHGDDAEYPVGLETIYTTDGGNPITGFGYWPPLELAKNVDRRLLVAANSLDGVFDGLWQIWGIAPTGTKSVEIRFGDGATKHIPTHDGLFAYVAGDELCRGGHKPIAVMALAADGSTIDRDTSQLAAACS